jgi:hypothetical protein
MYIGCDCRSSNFKTEKQEARMIFSLHAFEGMIPIDLSLCLSTFLCFVIFISNVIRSFRQGCRESSSKDRSPGLLFVWVLDKDCPRQEGIFEWQFVTTSLQPSVHSPYLHFLKLYASCTTRCQDINATSSLISTTSQCPVKSLLDTLQPTMRCNNRRR